MLECGFESQLGLEFSGFGLWHISEARRQGFSLGTATLVSSPSFFNGSTNEIKLR